MSEPDGVSTCASAGRSGKAKRDRLVKIVFLALTVLVAAVVWRGQVTGTGLLEGWGTDLNQALRQARDGNQRVLLLFIHSRPSDDDRFVATATLAKNDPRISAGRFLRVKATVPSSMDTPLAKEYKVQATPTILMLDPRGRELGRLRGRIGESDFAAWLAEPNRR